ncbi:MAG: RHS repeat-associated core domain-containing protein [Chloroflexota bacterium]
MPTGHSGTSSAAPTALPSRPGPSATSQTLVYGYDSLYRLTSASGGPAGSTSYTYDPVGNRLSRTRGSTSLTYSYDRADRISSAGATSYTVDAAGNMTVRGTDCLGYDQANRLKTLDTGCNSSADASYAYDGDGKRSSKTVGSTTTTYVYDVNRGLPVLLEDGTRRYVWGLGLAYEVESGNALVYHVDGLGSVRALTDSTKAVVQTYESDEFGVPIASSGGSSQPFGFTGEQRDLESSLVYLRSRIYDPTIGRFLSRDPFAGTLGAPGSLHRFVYVQNRPTFLVDPTGLDPEGNQGGEYADECFKEYQQGRIISIQCMWLIWMREHGVPVSTPSGTTIVSVPQASPDPPYGQSDGSGRGNVRWSSPAVREAASALQNGATQVYVKTRQEAEEIFLRLYQGEGYKNTTGLHAGEVKDMFGDKVGTYHWDPAGAEWGLPHLQIHTFDGTIIRIFFER